MAKYSNGLEDNLNLPDSSRTILEARYLKKDGSGKLLETGEQMYRRVARNISTAEAFYLEGLKDNVNRDMSHKELYSIIGNDKRVKKIESQFFKAMTEGYFIPNSPTLMNAERDLQQLAACFVLPVEDSIEGIFDALKNTALVHKSGGGTGFSFSRLRPSKSYVKTTGGIASGPVSFMKIFNAATEQVKQGGTRRGANMGILRVDHPDIEEFIYSKNKENGLNNFNISVALTDEFMEAAKRNANYDLINPQDGSKVRELNAAEVYHNIIHQAWENGDPGVIYIDRINRDNPTPELGEIESTNPCGEQPLLPLEACNLGAINLEKFVDEEANLKQKDLEKIVCLGTRFLDDAIDMGKYPLPEITSMVEGNRKIGLGVMGWADYLAARCISYKSDEALQEAEKIMKFITENSVKESEKLAQERGAFPNFDKSVFKKRGDAPRRNATNTTIAPTGTGSIINANASQGIEPLYLLAQIRHVEDSIGKDLIEVNPQFKKYLQKNDMDDNGLISILLEEGSFDKIFMPQKIKNEIKKLFPTAHEIDPEWHVKMQAAFQKHTHNAVSKTVNLSSDATPEDVKKVYDLAFELGCKGITIYRDKSKKNQVLTSGKKEKGLERKVPEGYRLIPIRGRDIKNVQGVQGVTYEMPTGCGPLFVTLNYDEQGPIETFLNMNPPGGCAAAQTAMAGILTSFNLHRSEPPERIIKHLRAVGCPEPNKIYDEMSCAEALATSLNKFGEDFKQIQKGHKGLFFKEEKKQKPNGKLNINTSNSEKVKNGLLSNVDKSFCPDCKSKLDFAGGCRSGTCSNCGWSLC